MSRRCKRTLNSHPIFLNGQKTWVDWRHFTKENTGIASKHMGRWLVSVVAKEMQMKATWEHLVPTRVAEERTDQKRRFILEWNATQRLTSYGDSDKDASQSVTWRGDGHEVVLTVWLHVPDILRGHCRARKQCAGCPEVEWLPTCLRESLGRWKHSITSLWRWLHHCVPFSKLIKLYTYWLLLYLQYTIIKHIQLFFSVMGA